jgi:hypothetical protein
MVTAKTVGMCKGRKRCAGVTRGRAALGNDATFVDGKADCGIEIAGDQTPPGTLYRMDRSKIVRLGLLQKHSRFQVLAVLKSNLTCRAAAAGGGGGSFGSCTLKKQNRVILVILERESGVKLLET